MLKNSKLVKKMVSGISALVMLAGNVLPLMPINVSAEAAETAAVYEQETVSVPADTQELAAEYTDVQNLDAHFETSGEDIEARANTDENAVFTVAGAGEEVACDEVAMYARQLDEAPEMAVEAGEGEHVKYFDVGFVTEDGETVQAENIETQIDFSLTPEAGESIAEIQVYALYENESEPVLIENAATAWGDFNDTASVVTVEDNKTAVYAVRYTVDFHYSGYTYSIGGGSEILLSRLFAILGIDEDVKGSTVRFTDGSLIALEKIAAEDGSAEDWKLVSLRSFDTAEKLTAALADGSTVEINVTDDTDDAASRYILNLDLKIVEGAVYENLFKRAAETYYDKASNSYILPEGFKYKLSDGNEWTIEEYANTNGILKSDDNTYTVSAENVPTDNAWVWTPNTSDEDHRIVYGLSYVTAGYNVIKPGELEIRVPKSIFPANADSLELSMVTKEEYNERKATARDVANIRFVYEFVDDDILFTNVKEIPSGSDGTVYIAYHTTKKTYEYEDMDLTSDVTAKANIYKLYDDQGDQIKSLYDANGNRLPSVEEPNGSRTYTANDGTPITAESNKSSDAAPVYINTGVEIKSLTKTLTQSGVYERWNTDWGAAPENDNKYIYFCWEIKSEIYTQKDNPTKITQSYDFALTEDTLNYTVTALSNTDHKEDLALGVEDMENILYKMAGGTWKDWSDEAGRKVTGLTEKDGTVRRDYVVTRVLREKLKTVVKEIDGKSVTVGTAFQIENTAKTTVHPRDGVDIDTSKKDSEKFTYAPPKYTAPEPAFDMTKVGVYTKNEQTVYNENQISSFNLEDFKVNDADIEGLRYHVSVTAEDLANTFEYTEYNGDERDTEYYQQRPVDYTLTDNKLELYNLDTKKTIPLTKNDYRMTALDVNAYIKAGKYDDILRTFVSAEVPSTAEDAKITLRLFDCDKDEYVDVAEYDEATDTWTVRNSDYVSMSNSSFRGFKHFEFAADKNITAYQLYSSNKYYGTYYKAYPTVTLKATPEVKAAVGTSKKVQLNNYADLNVTGKDHNGGDVSYNFERMGKVYVAEATRESYLTKEFISTDYNDIMNGEYLANWVIELYENMQTDVDTFVPVVQGGGTFYDLLPIMSTARLDEIEVYPMYEGKTDYEKEPLHEGGDYTVDYSYQIDKSGFKRVLLKVDISQPAYKYKLQIRTIHTHTDILDYGRNVRNSVCYKTKNNDLGSGTVNDGGDIVDGSVFANMSDEIGDADKKKFMYSQATHYIPALISTVSEIQKTVSSETTPTAGLSAIVTPNEEYVYHYRNMNTGSTYSKNLVIMDAIENYRKDDKGTESTEDDVTYNGSKAFDQKRDWTGTPLHFETQLLDRKGVDYTIYVSEKELNLGRYSTDVYDPEKPEDPDRDSDGNSGYVQIANASKFENGQLTSTFVDDVIKNSSDDWFKIEQVSDYANNSFTFKKYVDTQGEWVLTDEDYDFSKVRSFMIDFGDHRFNPNESVIFGLAMRAPSAVPSSTGNEADHELKTYNNIYRYHDTSTDKDFKDDSSVTRTFTHQDKTDVIYRISGDVKLRKVDASDTDKVIHNAVFVLEGESYYGQKVRKEMSTDANGIIVFSNIERGTYTLRETDATANYQIADPRTVTIDEYGVATFDSADDLYAFDITLVRKNADDNPVPFHSYKLTRLDGGKTGSNPSTSTAFIDASQLTQNQSVTAQTNTAGVVQFTNVPAGRYKLEVDSTAPTGEDAKVFTIDVKDGTPKNAVVYESTSGGTAAGSNYDDGLTKIMLVRKEYGIKDEPRYHGDLFFKKVLVDPAATTEKPTVLSGAKFRLTTIGNDSGDHNGTDQYGTVYDESAVSSDIGVTFENIAIGKYVLTETETPEGAVPGLEPYYVWVQVDSNKNVTVSLYDDPEYSNPNNDIAPLPRNADNDYTYTIKNTKTSEIVLYKRDNVNMTEKLAGAQFYLYPYGTVDGTGSVTAISSEDLKKLVHDDALNSDYWRSTEAWGSYEHSGVPTDIKTQFKVSDAREGALHLYELQPGIAYKLQETKAPANHNDNSLPYWWVVVDTKGEVTVLDKSNKKLENAYQDGLIITNERTYKSYFNITKNWVGGSPLDTNNVPTTFPVITVSTEEKIQNNTPATIKRDLFRNQFPTTATSFTRLDLLKNNPPTTVEDAWKRIQEIEGTDKASDMATQFIAIHDKSGTITYNYFDGANTVSKSDKLADEKGVIYMANIDNHVYFWSDAGVIYLPTDCNSLLLDRKALTGTLDFSNFNCDRVQKMELMFKNCWFVEKIKVPDFVSGLNIATMKETFRNCFKLEGVDLSNLKTSNTLTNMNSMFSKYGSYGNGWDNSDIANSNYSIRFGPNFNTSGVEDMTSLFAYCRKLSEIEGLEYFNTTSAKTFNNMFRCCDSLTSLNLSSFNAQNVTDMKEMFRNCSTLETVTFGSEINTGKVTTMQHMFAGCHALTTINGLYYFDTRKVESFDTMFGDDTALTTIDLSSFSTQSLKTIAHMFQNSGVRTVYANPLEWKPEDIFKRAGEKAKAPEGSVYADYYYSTVSLKDTFHQTGINKNGATLYNTYGAYARVNEPDGEDLNKNGVSGEIGYFTSWTESPHYADVYNKYRETHTDLPPLGGSASSLARLANILPPRPMSADAATELTAPKVDYITGNTALTQEQVTALGYTYDSKYFYVTETLKVNDVEQAEPKLIARWTVNSDDQWECELMVYDSMAECYVWESEKITYTDDSGATKEYERQYTPTNRLKVEEGTGYAEITNTKPGSTPKEYGSLALSKLIYVGEKLTPDDMHADDEFTFEIVLTPTEGETLPEKARYGGVEFTKDEGTLKGTVTITRTVQDSKAGTDYGRVLSRIPAGWQYEITEVLPANSEYENQNAITEGAVLTGISAAEGTIVKDTVDTETQEITAYGQTVTWKNELKTASLKVSKTLFRREKDETSVKDKDLTDSDKAGTYEFTVSLSGLMPNETYHYTVDGAAKDLTADASGSKAVKLDLKTGQAAAFTDLPLGAYYTVAETQPEEANADYQTNWSRNENSQSKENSLTAETDRLDGNESVAFTNIKTTTKTVDVTVEKFWFADEADRDETGDVALVTLQRSDGMSIVTPDNATAELNKDNGWKYTFPDNPVVFDGKNVTYTIGELTAAGYKPGVVSSVVDKEIVYGRVNVLKTKGGEIKGYFAYKTRCTFTLNEVEYKNKAVEVCKTDEDKVYMYYDGKLYEFNTTTKTATLYQAVEAEIEAKTNLVYEEGTQYRFMTYTDPDSLTDYVKVYESYVPQNMKYSVDGTTSEDKLLPCKTVITENDGATVKYILHTDNIFYSAETAADQTVYRLKKPKFKLNTSDEVISKPNGDLTYIVTNRKVKTFSLTIHKDVDGNFGNKVRPFEFDVIAGSLNGDYPVKRTYGSNTTPDVISFTGGVGSITVYHGQSVTISNLPEDTNILVRETNCEDYIVESKESTENIEGDPKKGGEISFVLDKNKTVTFKNTLIGTVPTGVEMPAVFVIFISLSTLAAAAYVNKRRRSAQEAMAAQ